MNSISTGQKGTSLRLCLGEEQPCFFGLSKQENGTSVPITEEQFNGFLKFVVTPLFPDGLTVLNASGQYLKEDGFLSRERSKCLILFHPDTPDSLHKLDYIWRNYTVAFQQESVLIATEETLVCFNDVCFPSTNNIANGKQSKIDYSTQQIEEKSTEEPWHLIGTLLEKVKALEARIFQLEQSITID